MTKKLLVLLVTTLVSVVLISPPAQAVIITKQGTTSTRSGPNADQPYALSNARGCPGTARGYTFVVLDGDYIVVADQCKDGRGIMGEVQWQEDGEPQQRRCQNLRGVGTKVECNFDWPEDVTPKSIVIWVRAETGSAWELGQVRHWFTEG